MSDQHKHYPTTEATMHALEQHTNGATAFASAREHAWHRLGTVVDHAMSAQEALELAHLANWNVRKTPLTTTEVEGTVPVPGHYAMVRTNPVSGGTDVLGVVGNRYTPIQNEAHTELLNALLHESHGQFETAGSLRGGREVFVSTKIPAHFTVGGVDPIDLYLLAVNSHDGTTPFRIAVTPVRVVCANTLSAAMHRTRSVYTIRHTRGYTGNIERARQALELSLKYRDELAEAAEKMINHTMTDAQFDAIITQLFPTPDESAPTLTIRRDQERRHTLHQLFADSPTNTEIRGTNWAGYQAITEYFDHYAPTRLNQWAPTEDTARSLRAISPATTTTKTHAFNLTNN